MTGAWRAMMDNAGDSSGANYVFGPGIQPIDGHWELTGKKGWRLQSGGIDDVKKAFNQFQVQNNQAELQNVIEMALQFADLETGIPTIFQGEVQKTPETLGATNIMVDSSNIGLRQRVKLFVDDVLDPLLTRFYHWNMQFNEDEEIKGDYQVDAHGPGVLLERDTQTQSLIQLFQLKGDPDVSMVTDWEKVVKQLFQNQRLDVMASEEEIAQRKQQQQQAQQPAPQVQSAQIRAQTEIQKAQLDAQSNVKEEQMKMARSQADNKTKIAIAQIEKEISIMEMAQNTKLTIEEINAKLTEAREKMKVDMATESAKLNTQKELSVMSQVTEPAFEPP
jgi:hypothetical protein